MSISFSKRVTDLEQRMVSVSGPIGKFVVKKKVKDLGITESNFSEMAMKQLIRSSVEAAIFDPEKKSMVIKQLTKEFCIS